METPVNSPPVDPGPIDPVPEGPPAGPVPGAEPPTPPVDPGLENPTGEVPVEPPPVAAGPDPVPPTGRGPERVGGNLEAPSGPVNMAAQEAPGVSAPEAGGLQNSPASAPGTPSIPKAILADRIAPSPMESGAGSDSGSRPVPDAASGLTDGDSRGVADARGADETAVGGLANELALAATGLLENVPEEIGDLIQKVGRLASGLERAVGWLLGDVGRVPGPVEEPLLTGATGRAALPPPATSGCSPLANGPSFGGSGVCGGAFERILDHFGALAPTPMILSQSDEIAWLSREPLRPSSAPRPPNERPG